MIPTASGLPFDDIRALFARMPPADGAAAARARAALAPPGAAPGRLAALAEWLAAWQGRAPAVNRPLVAVFAGTHGLAAGSGDATATRRQVETLAAGGGALSRLCAAYGLGLKVFDLALDVPTRNSAEAPALEEAECAATMAFGMEAIAGVDLLCVGALGAGGALAAAALSTALFGGSADDWAGGTAGAAPLVAAALARHHGHLRDPLEAMRRLGGRETAAIAGAILAARLNRVPVIVDGAIATAAAAVLHAADAAALDHCLFADAPAGSAHARALARMGKTALLDLGIGPGDGTGAAVAAAIVKGAASICAG
jgi:nicotinate-nucleotide--dimethylbenzimidazole phosphoribosyltransferase